MKLNFIRIIEKKSLLFFFSIVFSAMNIYAQDTIRYLGKTFVNVDYHHGQIPLAIGVHNIQVLRANREHPEMADGYGWTYNHAPMLAYWNNTFYLEYLSNPIGEHLPPGQTLITTSKDGYCWKRPVVVFPPYKIPDGTTKEGYNGVAKNLYAVMHQRMGFYVSTKNRLLVLAYYGICLDPKDSPNDGEGIGRVVREIYKDGTFGPIFFIRYNSKWNDKNTSYPFYKSSKDKGFIETCDELLSNPLMMQQWNEEADRDDPLIPIKKDYKAFCFYHLPDGHVIGLWKHALTAISNDNGKTWTTPVRAPGFVNANAKIWAQKTSDNKYVTVYNPSMFRWPLALSVSNDGINYYNLLLVQGEISTMRYGGAYKNYGPQYVRGIIEGNGTVPDGNIWVTYSMNKEDIWVARIKVPVTDKQISPVNEVFDQMPQGKELDLWNIYSPLWATVKINKINGIRCIEICDSDKYDFAKAERIIPSSKKGIVSFSLSNAQNNNGELNIELQDYKGNPAIRLIFDSEAMCKVKAGYRFSGITKYNAYDIYNVSISYDTETRFYTVNINGKEKRELFFAPVETIDRIVFRTGQIRRYPDADSPAEQSFDMPNPGIPDAKAIYYIFSIKTE
jgi:hypothetical protein